MNWPTSHSTSSFLGFQHWSGSNLALQIETMKTHIYGIAPACSLELVLGSHIMMPRCDIGLGPGACKTLTIWVSPCLCPCFESTERESCFPLSLLFISLFPEDSELFRGYILVSVLRSDPRSLGDHSQCSVSHALSKSPLNPIQSL